METSSYIHRVILLYNLQYSFVMETKYNSYLEQDNLIIILSIQVTFSLKFKVKLS